MELWDAYTRDGKRTGQTLVRGEPIPDGLYHLVCDVLVRHRDGSYLCMKRSSTKDIYPGYYEATAGGSALAGEDPLQCIRRELEEETGIVCEEFTKIGYDISRDTLYHSFFCTVSCDKNSVCLQPGETEDYVWMTEPEFIRFIDEMIPPRKKRLMPFLCQLGYIKTEQ